MIIEPYNIAKVKKDVLFDYSISINGLVYELSVDQKTGKMYIDFDPSQPSNLLARDKGKVKITSDYQIKERN